MQLSGRSIENNSTIHGDMEPFEVIQQWESVTLIKHCRPALQPSSIQEVQ